MNYFFHHLSCNWTRNMLTVFLKQYGTARGTASLLVKWCTVGSKKDEKLKEILINMPMKRTLYQVHWIWISFRFYYESDVVTGKEKLPTQWSIHPVCARLPFIRKEDSGPLKAKNWQKHWTVMCSCFPCEIRRNVLRLCNCNRGGCKGLRWLQQFNAWVRNVK